MGCFDLTLNERNASFLIFRLTRKQFWKFRSHTEQRSTTRKANFLIFDLLGLEIAFSLENEKDSVCKSKYIVCFYLSF